ncbi:YdcF family protein [Pontibacter ruber]|uniref:YdcF family protein n=1 Tax=Pontibacter ruber TaxID=1343895 RepID=A0ABW5CTL0_9BACT|nr:YdcF family protein [Pontibacter ruber]
MQPNTRQVLLFNTIISFLAKRDVESLTRAALVEKYGLEQVDLLILLGNSSLYVAEQAALAYINGLAKDLMICGGIGHSTHYLAANVKQHERYHTLDVTDRPEADILKDVLVKYWGIPESEIMLENRSTNCGGNAVEAGKVLEKLQKVPQSILLMQDPVLQRRSQASFGKVWQKHSQVQFISYAAFVPLLKLENQNLVFANSAHAEFCSIARFL